MGRMEVPMTNFRQKKSLGAERGEEGVAAERLRFQVRLKLSGTKCLKVNALLVQFL